MVQNTKNADIKFYLNSTINGSMKWILMRKHELPEVILKNIIRVNEHNDYLRLMKATREIRIYKCIEHKDNWDVFCYRYHAHCIIDNKKYTTTSYQLLSYNPYQRVFHMIDDFEQTKELYDFIHKSHI